MRLRRRVMRKRHLSISHISFGVEVAEVVAGVGEFEERVTESRSEESGLKGRQRCWCPYRTLLF